MIDKLDVAKEALSVIESTVIYGSPLYTQNKALALQRIARRALRIINGEEHFDFNNDADALRHDILLELTEQN